MPDSAAPLPDADILYDEAACGLLLTAADGTIRRVNATFCRWIGHDAEALVGQRKLQDLLTMGGRIFHQTHWLPLLQLQGSVAEVKLELRHQDGRALPMLVNAIRRELPSGVVVHELALLVTIDRHKYERELVLARRQADESLAKERAARRAIVLAEARLRLALDSAGLFVWEVDVNTGERRYEDQVARLLGHAAPRPVDHAELAAAIDGTDREREARTFAEAVDAARSEYQCTYRLNGVDGRQRMVSSTGRGVFDAAGAPLRFVGVLQDVTESVRLRATAEDRALLAEQMIGIVSHDLRNPLSAIKMSAVLLGRGTLDGGQRAVLGRIVGAVNRARRLVADLLDFTLSRVGRGLSVALQPIDLHAVVAGAVDELAVVFDGRILRHERIGDGLCMADAHRLTQLLGNLVANAMAYGAAGRPVRVISRIDDRTASLMVHNEGVPIPPALLPQLFEPMTRGDSIADNSQRSVGLGLYIVRQIAHAHAGEVSVESTARHGTTFSLTMPRQPSGMQLPGS